MSFPINLDELQAQIESEKDFVIFLDYLVADLKQNPANWENDTLSRFLKAMSSWTKDMDGFYKNQGIQTPELDWKFIGQLLLASRIYE